MRVWLTARGFEAEAEETTQHGIVMYEELKVQKLVRLVLKHLHAVHQHRCSSCVSVVTLDL